MGGAGEGGCINPLSSLFDCTVRCTPTQVPHSDKAVLHSITGRSGDTVTVVCDDGYVGGGPVTCGVDGLFSAANCTAVDCGAPEAVGETHITGCRDTTFTGNCSLACNAGYAGDPPPFPRLPFSCCLGITRGHGTKARPADQQCGRSLQQQDVR